MKKYIILLAILALVVIAGLNSIYTVAENQYACTFRFSEIVNTENQPGLRTLIHIMVMTLLFIVSFTVQQRWVFAAEKRSKEKV